MSDETASPRPRLRTLKGFYSVCRLPPGTPVEVSEGDFFALTRTAAETSVVCRERDAPAGAEIETGWRLIEVEGPLAFTQIGVLAGLAAPLAAAAVSIFAVSTYDTDYLLVPGDRLERARGALEDAGFVWTDG